jgi:hypothetical protein
MGDAAMKRGTIVRLNLPRARRMKGHVAGLLVGRDERGVLVDFAGNPHGPLVARATVPLEGVVIDGAPAKGPEVLLVFEHERSDQPIVVGLLGLTSEQKAPTAPLAHPPKGRLEAVVDGARVVLDARDEIVLQCGEASITLRRNGRVVIRGAYVETRSRGVNRIKGGTVQIN